MLALCWSKIQKNCIFKAAKLRHNYKIWEMQRKCVHHFVSNIRFQIFRNSDYLFQNWILVISNVRNSTIKQQWLVFHISWTYMISNAFGSHTYCSSIMVSANNIFFFHGAECGWVLATPWELRILENWHTKTTWPTTKVFQNTNSFPHPIVV